MIAQRDYKFMINQRVIFAKNFETKIFDITIAWGGSMYAVWLRVANYTFGVV